MYASDRQELVEYLGDPQIRHAYIDSSLRQTIAMQIRSMREAKDPEWSQAELGKRAGDMKQASISRLEDPRYVGMTLTTLKRLATAFDVGLIVRFAPFSEIVDWTIGLTEESLAPKSFDQDIGLQSHSPQYASWTVAIPMADTSQQSVTIPPGFGTAPSAAYTGQGTSDTARPTAERELASVV